MPKKRDPRFTFDVYATSDRVLLVDGVRTNLAVRQWSEGWWGVREGAAWVDSWVSNGVTCFGRTRRWRSIEKAEDGAIETWLAREEKTLR